MSQREHFRMLGQIVDREPRRGVPGLHVEAWDKDLICNDPAGSAVTDANGRFTIVFDGSYFRDCSSIASLIFSSAFTWVRLIEFGRFRALLCVCQYHPGND